MNKLDKQELFTALYYIGKNCEEKCERHFLKNKNYLIEK